MGVDTEYVFAKYLWISGWCLFWYRDTYVRHDYFSANTDEHMQSSKKPSKALELKQIKPPLLDQAASYPSVHLEGFPQHKFYYIQICELSQFWEAAKESKWTLAK